MVTRPQVVWGMERFFQIAICWQCRYLYRNFTERQFYGRKTTAKAENAAKPTCEAIVASALSLAAKWIGP